MKADVDHLIAIDPLLRRGLGNESSAEFVEKRGILETREQLAGDLFTARFRQKFDFTKLTDETSIDQLVELVSKPDTSGCKRGVGGIRRV